MSRGPGKGQHGILAALKAHPAVYLNDLLPKDGIRAGYNSLRRAAHALASGGASMIWRRVRADGARVVLGRLGCDGSEAEGAAQDGKAIKGKRSWRRGKHRRRDGKG